MAYMIKCKDLKLPEVRKKKTKGKYAVMTKEDAKKYVYENLAEHMQITDINQVLSTDTTEVKLEFDGKQHVSFVIDAYSTEIIADNVSKKLNIKFIQEILKTLANTHYKFQDIIIHSDRGGMYKSSSYKEKTKELNLIPSMSAPYTCTHNPWIETINGQFKDFIKGNYPKSLNELQIVIKQFVHYNNNIKIKPKLKMTPIEYRRHHG